ncbi:Adenylate_kinase 4 [Hexamita inflata]|uniref:Adenylate_kinase 4 n=1 Tax=Hexamita inflata TaxID=28002 RepID=A0ABP1GEP2_9EUKA
MQPIVFVLGKPGCGKGTTCSYLSHHLPVQHFSAGDLLRQEVQNPRSLNAQIILDDMKAGRIVKPEITVQLLREAMEAHPAAKAYIIDGFPRELEQLEFFKQQIDVERCFMLHLNCSDEECFSRIHGRHSNRVDDNDQTIKNRLQNFADETLKVINLFKHQGRLMEVNANADKLEVCQNAFRVIQSLVGIRK